MRTLRWAASVLWLAIQRFNANDGFPMAGSIAFSALLSLFPFLIFATTMTGFLVGHDKSDQLIDALFEIAPEHVARTIEPVVHDVVGGQSGSVLTLSALFAIWVASNAVESIRLGFDRAYAVKRPDNMAITRARAIGMVFLGALVAALLGVSILLSPLLLRLAEEFAHVRVARWASSLAYMFGVLVFIGFLLVMHRVLPGRHSAQLKVWPGVLVTTLIWVVAARGFSTYLSHTPTYTVTYGTLAGVIITLMFFYLTAATIIFGAEFNSALARVARIERRRDGA
jgi:membrane protein